MSVKAVISSLISVIKALSIIARKATGANIPVSYTHLVVVSIIATFGTVQIAANSVANSIDGMGTIVGQSFGLAMITVVGQCVGAGSEKQVRYYTKKLLKLAYLFTAVVNSCLLYTSRCV